MVSDTLFRQYGLTSLFASCASNNDSQPRHRQGRKGNKLAEGIILRKPLPRHTNDTLKLLPLSPCINRFDALSYSHRPSKGGKRTANLAVFASLPACPPCPPPLCLPGW